MGAAPGDDYLIGYEGPRRLIYISLPTSHQRHAAEMRYFSAAERHQNLVPPLPIRVTL